MNKKYLFFFLVIISGRLYSQDLFKDCFNATGEGVDEEYSEYCIVGKKILRVDKHPSGKIDTVETYVDTVMAYYSNPKRRIKFLKIFNDEGYADGNFVEYHPNGKVKQRGSYKQGSKIGYFTNSHPNGRTQSTLQFFSEEQKISDLSETNFKILSYYDSSGNQLIKSGKVFCRCTLESGRIEMGKVVDGLRDSIWSEYAGDTLILQEEYSTGRFVEGVRYYKGLEYKYSKFEELPSYPGGYEAMMEVIRKNMRYPVSARRSGIDGTVYVSFVIKEDGSIDHLRVIKGVGQDCDEEALRAVSFLTKWNPGQLRGKPVSVRFNLPIKFKLG